MEQSEEYINVQKDYKGENWIIVEPQLLNVEKFVKIGSHVYRSPHTNKTYNFVLNGRGEDEYVTRIEIVSEDGIECSFDKTCISTPIYDDKVERERIKLYHEIEIDCCMCASIINDYWVYSQRQNHHYRKNKENIDKVISAYKSIGFDFTREIDISDALMIGNTFCVIEFKKRTNNSRLYKTIQSESGNKFYIYKAKEREGSECIFSGIFIKCTLGEDLFRALKVSDKYKIY